MFAVRTGLERLRRRDSDVFVEIQAANGDVLRRVIGEVQVGVARQAAFELDPDVLADVPVFSGIGESKEFRRIESSQLGFGKSETVRTDIMNRVCQLDVDGRIAP